MNFRSINLTYILFIILSAALCGCRDDFPWDDVVVGDGVADIEGTFSFEPFGVALESRSPGDATKTIESLYMFVYDEEQQLYTNDAFLPTGFTKLDINLKDENNERPSNDNATSAETNTPKGTFNVRLPYGKYYIYLVANTDVSNWTEETNYGNIGLLLNNVVEWEGIGSGSNAEALPNKQMLGYMTADNTLSFDEDGQLMPEGTVTLNKKYVQLKGWLKRVSSKLTIAFDVSNLNDNTWIYIKSVRILDIPKQCYLGKRNYVMGEDEKGRGKDISDEFVDNSEVETFYFAEADPSHNWEDGAAHYRKWLELSNTDSVAGYWSNKNPKAVNPEWTVEQRLAAEHSETAPALYFLENMQGKGKDKRQDANGDNTIDFPKGGTEGEDGYKDNKKYGSYVEVEAYYVCQDRLNQSQGKIKYRFMLGKDVLTDYNAERNHHYKLTLKFNGYANDIDWHIEYSEEAYPGFQVPEIVYVSYSYNMGSEITLRATPKSGYSLQKIDAVIVQNEWWPNYDGMAWSEQNTNDKTITDQMNGNKPFGDWEAYKKNNNVVTSIEGVDVNIANSTEFGFLSLRKIVKDIYELGGSAAAGTYPGVDNVINPTTQKGNTYSNASQLTINFRDIYFTVDESADQDMSGPKYRRSYGNFDSYTNIVPTEDNGTQGKLIEDSKNDGPYTIYLNTDANGFKNYVFVVPLYTRAKTLDSWAVYSGANQFLGARRKAKVQFIATFVSDSDPTDKYTESKFTTVYQDYRMGNPRGIFRRGSNLQPFRVTLMNSIPAYSRTYGLPDVYHKNNEIINGVLVKGGIEDLMTFNELISQGTWTAVILHDPHGLVKLSKGTQVAMGEGAVIRGLTGSTISFTYTPRHTVPDNKAEGAVIQVRYHNGTCIHNILVRQGYGNVKFPLCDLEWATCNVYQAGELCKSPLALGSLYRRHTSLTHGIAESNINIYGLRCLVGADDKFRVLNGKGNAESELTWANLNHSERTQTQSNAFGTFTIDGVNYKLPNYKQVSEEWIDRVFDTDIFSEEEAEAKKVHMAFGVAYADGATSTLSDSRAISFNDYENEGKNDVRGTRGCFAYSNDGTVLFFPFGETGHAHRKGKRWIGGAKSQLEHGFNAYGSVDVRLGGYTTGTDSLNLGNGANTSNQQRPMAYDLPGQQGGIYWINNPGDASADGYISLDFNFGNLMTAYSAHGNIDNGDKEPDAGAIKPAVASTVK